MTLKGGCTDFLDRSILLTSSQVYTIFLQLQGFTVLKKKLFFKKVQSLLNFSTLSFLWKLKSGCSQATKQ